MAKGTLNKVMLIGRLGNDPDIRHTAAGAPVANLSIATNFAYKDSQSGEWHETTEWHRVVLFARTAEVARDYLRKGSLVYIEGRLQTRKWQDQSGVDRYSTEVVGERMEMIGSRSDNQDFTANSVAYNEPVTPVAKYPSKAAPVPAPIDNRSDNKSNNYAPDNFDDDIPF